MIKKYLQTLSLTIVCCCMFITAASARVCFLPDEKNCGLASNLNLPESTNTVIPCEFKTCKDTNLNTDLEICDHVGTCYYKKCKLTQSKCEKQRKNNQECLLDITTGCYDLKEIETCPAIYTRDKNDIHGDCKECVDKKGSHWYCQYDSCNALYAGSSTNPTCSEGFSPKYVGTSVREGKCYICDPNPDTSCSSYTDVEKDGSCWSCESCPADRNKFKCTENVREGYEIKNGVCQLSSQTKTCKQLGEEKNEYWKGDKIDTNCINPAQIVGVFGSDGQCYKCGNPNNPNSCLTGTATVYVAEYYYYRSDENVCDSPGLRYYGRTYILSSRSSEEQTLPAEVSVTDGNSWTLSTSSPVEKKDCSQKIIQLSDYTKIFGTENSEFSQGFTYIKSTKTKCFRYAGASKDEYITDDINQVERITCAGTYVVVGGCKEIVDNQL